MLLHDTMLVNHVSSTCFELACVAAAADGKLDARSVLHGCTLFERPAVCWNGANLCLLQYHGWRVCHYYKDLMSAEPARAV